ncbi:acylphosphatase [Euzebya sp.]|uniref:acylphosphatase n=1 Tax=Euzebya sp. TaxID=1971409 RepID=UPI0035156D05
MAELIRRRLRVTGHVQGVFFRASTRDVAEEVGVTGWVRNDPDGAVTAELQGSADAVEAVARFCHDGPPHARVDGLAADDIPVVEGETGFRTR